MVSEYQLLFCTLLTLTAFSAIYLYKSKKKLNKFFVYLAITTTLVGYGLIVESNELLISTPITSTNATYYNVQFAPGPATTKLITDTISKANKNIYLAAYYFTSQAIADSLIAANARGVEIKVVLDKSQASRRDSKYEQLLMAGIPTKIDKQYQIMHNKFMIIDGEIVETGSFNYTESAEKRNAENVLVIYHNPELAQHYYNAWQKLWDESE